MRQRADPQTAQLVYSCIARDHRWFWQVDSRALYLARLVRDLGLDTAPLVEQMWREGQDPEDPENAFTHVVEVLGQLGRIGHADVVDQVRRYIRGGDQWGEVLDQVVADWPADLWDDLDEVALDRCRDGEVPDGPWQAWKPGAPWAVRHPQIALSVQSARTERRKAFGHRPHAHKSGDELVALLADPDVATRTKTSVLRELARRPPQAGLLELVDPLFAQAEPSRGMPGLTAAVQAQGAAALEGARRWIRNDRPDIAWLGGQVLAPISDVTDIPLLVAEVRRKWDADEWCPYDDLMDALARFGPLADDVLPTLKALWRETPHSFERSSYLAALTAIDPEGSGHALEKGLLDCQHDVRLFAVRHVPLGSKMTRRILRYLRDDPLETDELRAEAAARLAR